MTESKREASYHNYVNDTFKDVTEEGYYNLTKLSMVKQEYPKIDISETLEETYSRIAVYGDHQRLVKLFINRGVDVNYKNSLLLMNAINNNDYRLAKYLFSNSALFEGDDNDRYEEPFIYAVYGVKNLKMVKLILQHREAPLSFPNLAQFLMMSNNLRIITAVFENRPEFVAERRSEFMLWLLSLTDIKALRYVIGKIRPFNNEESDKLKAQTILYIISSAYTSSSFNPNIEVIKILVENGQRIADDVEILLHIIAQGYYTYYYMTAGQDLDVRDISDVTYPIIDYLVSKGANVNSAILKPGQPYITPLTVAIWTFSTPLIMYILNLGANPNLYEKVAIKRAVDGICKMQHTNKYNQAIINLKLLIDYGAIIEPDSGLYKKLLKCGHQAADVARTYKSYTSLV
jgi:hypothetical protein